MSDPKKIVVRKAGEIDYRPGGLPGVRREEDHPEDHRVQVIEVHHVHDPADRAGPRGDDLLRKFVPYFVIAGMLVILLGGIALIMAMLLPMIVAMIGALVSIILSLVATIFAAVVIAMSITYCQTRNNITKKR